MVSIAILTVASRVIINVPTIGLLAVETEDSFVLFVNSEYCYNKDKSRSKKLQ